ncbi:MAG: ABC transporter ATP-binding protein [Ruminococcaceae bacterium]|nr:ABC transporter ATP-binding protein [Oscillospiraceae bacterium]
MLEIKHLTKSYAGSAVNAVEDLSISLRAGEIYGFLGSNGAGKSTTIKALVGIHPFQQGDILIDGVSIKTEPLKAKMQIGYVSDNHAVFERLTGREYVTHIANLYGVSPTDAATRCEDLLAIFNLKDAFDHPIKSYSHGMKQKISVIGALVHNPKLWVLDEPLTGLDPQSAYQLKKVMKRHARAGNTVFFSSHILDVVENLCDRCCIIQKGKLQGVYDLAELRAEGRSLERIFMGVIGEIEDGSADA